MGEEYSWGDRQLSNVADALPVLISVLDRDCRYRFNNKAYERWFDVPRSEMTGRLMAEVVGEAAFEQLRPHAEAALGGEEVHFETIVPYRTGGARHIDAHYVPRRGADGAVHGFVALVDDVTERKRRERELTLAFNAADMAAWDHDYATGAFTSPGRLNRLLGLPEQHLLTVDDIWRMIHPDDFAHLKEAQVAELRDGSVRNYDREFRIVRPDGTVRWLYGRGEYFRNDAGEPLRSAGVVLDVSGRKLTEEKLQRQSDRLGFLARVASGLIVDQDPVERLASLFAETASFIGSDAYFHYMVDEEDPAVLALASSSGMDGGQEKFFSRIQIGEHLCGRVAATGRPVVLSLDELSADAAGEAVTRMGWRSYAGFPLLANGVLIGTIAFCSSAADRFSAGDVELASTIAHHIAAALDRAKTEKRLRQNEERLRLILNSAREYAIVTLSPDGRVTSWSEGAEDLLGYSAEEALGVDEEIFFTPEDRADEIAQRERTKAQLEGRASNERWHVRKDGTRFWGSGAVVPLAGAEGNYLKILRDRTEERHAHEAAEEARRQSELLAAEREAVLGQLAEGVIVTDAAGAITFINKAAAALHGVDERGVTPERYSERFHLFTEDGRPYPPEELPLARAVRDGEVVVAERWRIRRADGAEILAIGSATPVRNGAGRVIGSVLTVRDDTERHAAEQALRHSNVRKELAIAAGRLGVWDWDIVTNELIWDDVQIALYGHDPATFTPTHEAFERSVHPDDFERFNAIAMECKERGTHLDAEFRIIRPDGAIRWIGVRAAVLRDAAGRPLRMIGINQDITERKRADERSILLINELNHRVKNTLATVQSIAAQTFRSVDDAQPLRQNFEGRLMALSKAHNVLTRESWEGASLREIAAEALSPFQEQRGERVRIVGSAVQLAPKAALAFAMAFHELAANAARFGALSNDTGEVDLFWSDDPRNDRLSLAWVERGGPPVRSPDRKGFGSRLVEGSLGGEIGGEVTIDYREEGLVCLIVAPLSGLVNDLPPDGGASMEKGIRIDV